jgi:C-terminal processing protease CtpA/Prc
MIIRKLSVLIKSIILIVILGGVYLMLVAITNRYVLKEFTSIVSENFYYKNKDVLEDQNSSINTKKLVDHNINCFYKNNNLAYIKIKEFGGETSIFIENILMDTSINSVIIDLRGNRGGYVRDSLNSLQLFIQNKIITTYHKKDNVTRYLTTGNSAIRYDGMLSLLIDGGTASSAEIFALGIKKYNKGIIYGSPSYGKKTMQKYYEIFNDEIIKLTIAEFNFGDGDDRIYPQFPISELPDIKFLITECKKAP